MNLFGEKKRSNYRLNVDPNTFIAKWNIFSSRKTQWGYLNIAQSPLKPPLPYLEALLKLKYLCSLEPTDVNQMVIDILCFQLQTPYLSRIRTFKFGFRKKYYSSSNLFKRFHMCSVHLGQPCLIKACTRPGGIQTFLYNSISNQLLSLAAKRRVLVSRSASQPNIVDVII